MQVTADISLPELARRLSRWWWVPVVAGLLGVVLGITYLRLATPTYESVAILGPKRNVLPTRRDAPAMSGLGGLVSAIQGGTNNPDMARADLFWTSQRLSHAFARRDDRLRLLLPERWDTAKGRWKPRSGLGAIVRAYIGMSRPPRPTPEEAQARIRKLFHVETQQQMFRVLRTRTPDPRRSEALLDLIIQLTNDSFRDDDLAEVDSLISFTDKQLSANTGSRQMELLAQSMLILQQERMQIQSSPLHMFELIQASTTETIPSQPNPALVLAISAILPPMLAFAGLLLLLHLGQPRRDVLPA